MNNTRVSFHTFGCRLNQSETATLRSSFRQNGYDVVERDDLSDIAVINTCTVTANGDADTIKLVRRITRRNPDTRIALIGCQAQMQSEALATLENVDWVIGNGAKMELATILQDKAVATVVDTKAIPRASFRMPVDGIDQGVTRANLKIQDGCDFYCFFCVIPYARGDARSRETDDVMREARNLVAAGYKELVLTGVNIGTYNHNDMGIAELIRELAATSGLHRLRISSIEPTTIPPALLPMIAGSNTLCRHLHIPLQSGCDEILHKMNRRYTAAEYREFLERAWLDITRVCLGTDVIVGYPGETAAHFDETFAFIEQLPFAYVHVFSYSERDKAKSSKIAAPVVGETIRRRSVALRRLSDDKRRIFMEHHTGRVETVLFEQMRDGVWTGLTDNFIRVRVTSDLDLQNAIVPVRLEEISGAAMTGTIA